MRYAETPDAGPWEYRGRTGVHTYSAAMCWVACDRLGRIAAILDRTAPADYAFSLDGNEQFKSLETFREFWCRLSPDMS